MNLNLYLYTTPYSLNIKKNLDSVRFSLFIAFLNSGYKVLLCLLRRVCNNDKVNAPIAGALSALSILIDTKSRR
jgi:hypothetical protein